MRPEDHFSKDSDETIFHERQFVTSINSERI